jgi:hypothetical protein
MGLVQNRRDMKKRATITVETERLLLVARSRQLLRAWCNACSSEADFTGVEEAAALTGMTQRRIFNLAEGGQVHLLETANGRALFCVPSLTKTKLLDPRR